METTPFSQLLSPVNLNYIKTGWRDTKATEETVMMDSVDSHISSKKTEGEERAQLWWTAKCKPHYWIGRQLLTQPSSSPCYSCWLSRKGSGFRKKKSAPACRQPSENKQAAQKKSGLHKPSQSIFCRNYQEFNLNTGNYGEQRKTFFVLFLSIMTILCTAYWNSRPWKLKGGFNSEKKKNGKTQQLLGVGWHFSHFS